MEHETHLKFSICIFEKHLKFQNKILDYWGADSINKAPGKYQKLINEKKQIEEALALIKSNQINKNNQNLNHAISYLRKELIWLNRQLEAVPSTQEVIDEIEYVTNLLKQRI